MGPKNQNNCGQSNILDLNALNAPISQPHQKTDGICSPVMWHEQHYNDVIMGVMVSQITSLTIVYSTIDSDADQRKHQSSVSLAFERGIQQGPVNSPHKWPVTPKMFPFDDVIMIWSWWHRSWSASDQVTSLIAWQLFKGTKQLPHTIFIIPRTTKLSVCGQNRVRSLSSTIIVRSISYLPILSSNFRRCVACNVCFKIWKFEILANS